MRNKYLLLSVMLFIGILLGYSLDSLNAYTGLIDYPASNRQAAFAGTCSQLNGKELTPQNLQVLDGYCFGGQGTTNEKMSKCNYEEIIKTLNEDTTSFFSVNHRKDTDNTWFCYIDNTNDGKIKASVGYKHE
jgi:hypothetical protein